MHIIGDVIVQDSVLSSKFACALEECKGACCTLEGGRGAPLREDELYRIEEAIPSVLGFLSEVHRSHIRAHGFFEGKPGDYSTTCVDDKACVFVYYERGIAKCSLERAYNEGLTSWKKPLSCHLFPVRITNGSTVIVQTEYIAECDPGKRKGTTDNVKLICFLEEPLRRRFGDEWYEHLQSHS